MANSYTDDNGVYRNKLGIMDAAQLRDIEYDLTAQRSQEILEENVLGHIQGFGLARQQAIHAHLFQDIYEWAGKIRTVRSSKRMDDGMVSIFADPDTIEKSWQALEQRTHAFANATGLSFEQKLDTLTDIFIEANRIHPFPEGNGRSLQVFMKELAHEQGVDLDYSRVNSKEWNIASAISGTYGKLFEHQYLIPYHPNPEPIKKIFAEMASPSRRIEQAKSPISAFEHLMTGQPPLHQLSTQKLQQLSLHWQQTLHSTNLNTLSPQDREDIHHYTKGLIEEGASRNWPRHQEVLQKDSRYGQHSAEEITKVAYYRAIREQANFFEGKEADWERFDSVMSDRQVLEKLQDISGLEEKAGQGREETQSQEKGQERDDEGLSL